MDITPRMRRKALLLFLTLLPAPAWSAEQPEPVRLDLYVMSHCPFGVQAENAVLPAVKALGKHVDFALHFIANEDPGAAGAARFRSLHGQPEVEENIRQLCAMKHFPQQYLDFILERNVGNAKGPDWQAAAKTVGIEPAPIEACATGEEGAALLSDSIQRSQARQASASPTIHLDGRPYSGPRGVRSITLAVCDALSAKGLPLPEACQHAEAMPPDPRQGPSGGGPPVAFDVKVVVEDACTFCEPTLIEAIRRQHPGARVSTLDAASNEGQAFIKRYKLQTLPFYFLDQEVARDPKFQTMQGYYVKLGDGYAIQPGPDTYTPTVQVGRPRVPRHLDVFVESRSPFTVQVEAELMRVLLESDVKDLTFSLHYLVQETVKGDATATSSAVRSPSSKVRAAPLNKERHTVAAGPLTSRRGEHELQESMRQACLFQHASIGTFFTYLTCRNHNILDDARGETCLQMTEALKQCLEGPESEALLRQDARLVRELGIAGGGPVFLWENRYGPFGWHEVDWQELLRE